MPLSCPTACDVDCDATCHEMHNPRWKWSHQPGDCPAMDYVMSANEGGAVAPFSGWLYGYGRTKHIIDPAKPTGRWQAGVGLCGAGGGYPYDEPDRPPCKRCVSAATKRGMATDG